MRRYSKNRILFLGAVGGMSYSAQLAKKMGLYLVVADYYEDSQAKKFADKSYLVSTTDVNGLSEIIENEKIEGIFTGFSDNNIRTAQALCKKYNFPCYTSFEQLQLMQNKLEFKKLCKEYDIPTPKQYDVHRDKIIYPVIVKPSDAYAAKGISVCADDIELEKAIEYATTYSKNGKVVIEKYIKGKEVMTHYAMLNGKLYITAVLDRQLPIEFDSGLKEIAPVLITESEEYLDAVINIKSKLEKMLISIGVYNAVGFLQGKAENNDVYFFEPAFRFGGNVSELFNVYCGQTNLIEKFLEYSLTGEINSLDINLRPMTGKCCCNISLFLKPGTVSKIIGESELYSIPVVKDVQRYCYIGQTICAGQHLSYSDIGYRLILIGGEKREVMDSFKKIEQILKVTDSNGNNMIDWETSSNSIKGCQFV